MVDIARIGTGVQPSSSPDGSAQPQLSTGEAYRTLMDFQAGLEPATGALEAANARVSGLESDLQRQIAEGAPKAVGKSNEEYSASFRKVNSGTYRNADEAAADVAGFLADNMPRAQAALQNPSVARDQMTVGGMALGPIQNATDALATYQAQAPGDHSKLAPILQKAASGAGFAAGQAAKATDAGATSALARAGGALGALGATIKLSELGERTARGQANLGTEMQAGAAGVQLGLAALKVGGIAVRGTNPVGMAATAVGIVGAGVQSIQDRNRIGGQEASVLRDQSVDPAAADAIGAAHPETRRAILSAGLSPQQLQAIAKASPDTLRTSPEATTAFLKGTGLHGQQLVDTLSAVGHGGSSFINKVAHEYTGYAPPRNLGELADRLERFQRLGTGFPLSPAEQRGADYLRTLSAPDAVAAPAQLRNLAP